MRCLSIYYIRVHSDPFMGALGCASVCAADAACGAFALIEDARRCGVLDAEVLAELAAAEQKGEAIVNTFVKTTSRFTTLQHMKD